MQYKILPAKDIQSGDVIFTNGNDNGIQFCGRAIGETRPRPHPDITEWRVEVVVGNEKTPAGTFTAIRFQHNTMVGVARDDKCIDIDVAAILADIDND